MYGSASRLKDTIQEDSLFHYIGFPLLVIDFCMSGIPVRLLNFLHPLGFSLLYNLLLLAFSYATKRQGPYYRVADYFSHDTGVSYHFVRHTLAILQPFVVKFVKLHEFCPNLTLVKLKFVNFA